MSGFISVDDAKVQTIDNICDFYENSTNPNDIMTHIIRNGNSDSMKMVICLHLIIMFKNKTHLISYLENIHDLHGSLVCEFMINYSIQNSPIYVSNQSPIVENNSINALTCAALWNTDPDVTVILFNYGANINSSNEAGLFSDEISQHFPYYNHLISFINSIDNSVNVVGKRLYNEFADVYLLLRQTAGEE